MILYEISKGKILKGVAGVAALAGTAYGAKKAIEHGEDVLAQEKEKDRMAAVERAYKKATFWDDFFGRTGKILDKELEKVDQKYANKGVLDKLAAGAEDYLKQGVKSVISKFRK